MKDVFIAMGIIITFPLWIIALLIIFLSISKNFWKEYDKYRTSEEEMYGF